MAIKSEVTDQVVPVKPFPKLMVSTTSGAVVLFYMAGTGMIVSGKAGSGKTAGYFSKVWDMVYFEDFKGRVTLENS